MKVNNNDNKINLIDYLIKSKNITNKEDISVQNKREEKDIKDKIELTRKAEFKRLKEMVKQASSVREDRVESVKEAIETKTYNVNGQLVAKSLLKDHILETIL